MGLVFLPAPTGYSFLLPPTHFHDQSLPLVPVLRGYGYSSKLRPVPAVVAQGNFVVGISSGGGTDPVPVVQCTIPGHGNVGSFHGVLPLPGSVWSGYPAAQGRQAGVGLTFWACGHMAVPANLFLAHLDPHVGLSGREDRGGAKELSAITHCLAGKHGSVVELLSPLRQLGRGRAGKHGTCNVHSLCNASVPRKNSLTRFEIYHHNRKFP